MKFSWLLCIPTVILMALPAVGQSGKLVSREEMKQNYHRPAAPQYPKDNAYSEEKQRLGQALFFDPRVSGSNWISCATCHNPGLSWGDGLPVGIGHGMKNLPRRTPTLLNMAWADLLMWDGRKENLEEQALGPIESAGEMNQDLGNLPKKITEIDGYKRAFAKVFGAEGVTLKTIGKAIATYERGIVSGTAPFDRWIAGDETAITDQAKQGFDLFNGKGRCAACHGGWNFTDNSFHDIGLPDADRGRGAILDLPILQHAFKTPTLRDIARRRPYMHNGSQESLMEVVNHYDHGAVTRPSLADEVKPLQLTEPEKLALVAFMETLTGEQGRVDYPILFVEAGGIEVGGLAK